MGQSLARAGYCVANGGYGGVMAASSQGAKSVGGNTIGVTCRAFKRSGPNQWVDNEVSTADLYERVQTLIDLGGAYVLLPGGTGTLVELALCWELMHKGFMVPLPMVCLTDYWRPVVQTVLQTEKQGEECVYFAGSAEEVVEILTRSIER